MGGWFSRGGERRGGGEGRGSGEESGPGADDVGHDGLFVSDGGMWFVCGWSRVAGDEYSCGFTS